MAVRLERKHSPEGNVLEQNTAMDVFNILNTYLGSFFFCAMQITELVTRNVFIVL